jgi:hypothetical protein
MYLATRGSRSPGATQQRGSYKSLCDLYGAGHAAPRSTAPTAARMAPWTTWSRSQPACSPATRRSRASNSPAPDPAERTSRCPTGTSPWRAPISTPSLETCRRSLRPRPARAAMGNSWATPRAPGPPGSNTASSITRRTHCRPLNPVETRWRPSTRTSGTGSGGSPPRPPSAATIWSPKHMRELHAPAPAAHGYHRRPYEHRICHRGVRCAPMPWRRSSESRSGAGYRGAPRNRSRPA